MTLGPVKVMEGGVVVMLRVEEVLLVELCFPCFTIILIVSCLPLNNPDDGMINCSLGDDGVPSYEDTCSFSCNTGYELTGSDTRTCQSNGSWSRNETICHRGICKI